MPGYVDGGLIAPRIDCRSTTITTTTAAAAAAATYRRAGR
jgi:hypothetical protein